jgi:hypothetical protein
MLTRVLTATAVFLALGQAADAGVFRRVSCTLVLFYVVKYSVGAAEAWARKGCDGGRNRIGAQVSWRLDHANGEPR